MSVSALKLRIDAPTGEPFPGRGFYQLEEDSLYVQVSPFSRQRRFFSYLESDRVRLDLDKEGRLLFIEVDCARNLWKTDRRLKPPAKAPPADIRWLDFRERVADPELLTDERRTALLIRFISQSVAHSHLLAQAVVVDVTEQNTLAGIWITDIVDDLAGSRIAEFRKRSRPPGEQLARSPDR